MAKLSKRKILAWYCVVAVLLLIIFIAVSYIPALSHLEMIFRILPQAWFYLFFGFGNTYVLSHYDKKEAENGAKYITINNKLLKKILIPNDRTRDSQGYIKVENRNKITISSAVLYLFGVLVVIGIVAMMLIPQYQTNPIDVSLGGRFSHSHIEINTVNSIIVYFSSLTFMVLPLISWFVRNLYFTIKSKKK